MGWKLADLTPELRQRLKDLKSGDAAPTASALDGTGHLKLDSIGAIVRAKEAQKLNKTEARFLDILTRRNALPDCQVRVMPMTFIPGFDLRYTPDFMETRGIAITFFEVKGPFIREDAIVKFKTAARMFPEFRWVLAQFEAGSWKETQFK